MKFEIPELEVITFDSTDILTSSFPTTSENELIGTIPPGGLPLD